MKIIALTDIHGESNAIAPIGDALSEVDLVLVSGDITTFGGWHAANQVIKTIQGYNENVLAIRGNCDEEGVGEYLQDIDIELNGNHREVDGYAVIGVGGALKMTGTTPNEHPESMLAKMWDKAVANVPDGMPLLMVTHQPPHKTLADRVRHGFHVGSVAVRQFIDKHKPLICFCGHIHEARCVDEVGGTMIINPGPLAEGGYAYAEVNEKVDVLEIRGIK